MSKKTNIPLDDFNAILADVRSGKPIVIIDDADRENEGDLMVAAEHATAENINFMIQEGRGLICMSITEERRRALGIPMQVVENSSVFGTNFAVSFDYRGSGHIPETARGRAETISQAVSDNASVSDFSMPGYVFPVCAVPGGVLRRRGQTEGSVDLSRLAGLKPAGVICEIMDSEGEMLRGQKLVNYCRKHKLLITSVESIVQYRLQNEINVRRIYRGSLSNDFISRLEVKKDFELIVYTDDIDDREHFVLLSGNIKDNLLLRIHSECLTGDVFESRRCDCGKQFNIALEQISTIGGAVIYLQQEGRGIGLGNKLRAYELQDKGFDTVDANTHLGFEPDERSYLVAAKILNDLNINNVRLMTNNPDKIQALEKAGINITERVPVLVDKDEYNSSYLNAKRKRLGHLV